MNNEKNIKELEPRPTDKDKQAHSNEVNQNNSTTNKKNNQLAKMRHQNQSLNQNQMRQFEK